MLKPFRIRDLLNDDLPSKGGTIEQQEIGGQRIVDGSSHPRNSTDSNSQDGIVQVTSTEYDETVTKNPDASLLYIDEDDGEFVTVGSSLELSQRLDEPVFAPATSPNTDDLSSMHLFDIRQSSSVLKTWKDFHSRSQQTRQPQHPISMPTSQEPTSPGPSRNNDPDSIVSTGLLPNFDDARNLWVQRCNPPKLGSSGDAEKDKVFVSGDDKIMGEDESSYITAEGRKQATAAGAKLRDSRNLSSEGGRSSFPSSSTGENFWSSYDQTEKAFKASADTLYEKELQSSEPANEEPVEPLLTGFGTELAKLMSEDLSTQPSAEGISHSHTAPTEPTQAEHGPPNLPPPVSGDPLAQTMHSLLSGISRLTMDMRNRLPEAERQLASLHENVPVQLESGFNNALQALRNHVQTLSAGIQEAAVSTRAAAERRRETEALALAQIDNLRKVAQDLGETGKSLFSSFEARIKAGHGGSQQVSSSGAQQERDLSSENASNPTKPSTSGFVLFVSNLPADCSEERLRDTFATRGFLCTVMPLGSLSIRDTRSAYVRFPSTYAASGALKAVQGTELDGQVLNLEFEDSPVDKSNSLRAIPAPSFTVEENQNGTREHTKNSVEQRSSSLKAPHRAHRPHRRPQNVNFVATNDGNTTNLSDLRRAKSLGGLRPHHPTRKAEPRNDALEHQRAPDVPPKEPHDVKVGDDHANGSPRVANTTQANMDHGNSTTFLDQDNTEAEFSARYPPLLSLNYPQIPKPPSPPKPFSEQRITRSSTVSHPTPCIRHGANAKRSRPARLADDVENATRQGRAEMHRMLQQNAETSRNLPSHPVRRSATERRPNHPRFADSGMPSSLSHNEPSGPYSGYMPGSFPSDNYNQSSVSLPIQSNEQSAAPTAADSENIDSCIRHLHALGFANGDMARLRIYAELSDGNLGDAIEMIEAERKALEWASRHQ